MRILVRHELTLLLRRKVTYALLALWLAAAFVAGRAGADWAARSAASEARVVSADKGRYVQLEVDIEMAVKDAAEEKRSLEPAKWGPVHPAMVGGQSRGARAVVLPRRPLFPFAVGESDVRSSHYLVSLEGKESVLDRRDLVGPFVTAVGRFDGSFLFLELLPLFLIVLGFDLLPRDRAARTFVHSQGVPLRSVLIAKSIVLANFMAVLVVSGTAMLAVGAGIGSSIFESPADLFFWIGSGLAWGGVWVAAVAAVSAPEKSAAFNAALLGAAWVIVVKIVPGTIDLAARTIFPLPTGAAMIDRNREATEEAMKVGDRMLSTWLVDHPELKGSGEESSTEDFYATKVLVDRAVAERLEGVRADAEKGRRARERLAAVVGYFSPFTIAETALAEAAGTSRRRFGEFREQVVDAHAQWRSYFEPLILERRPILSLDVVPRPRFVELPFSQRLQDFLRSFACQLLVAALLFFGFARRRAADGMG